VSLLSKEAYLVVHVYTFLFHQSGDTLISSHIHLYILENSISKKYYQMTPYRIGVSIIPRLPVNIGLGYGLVLSENKP